MEVYEPELVNGVFTVNDSNKKVKFTKGNLVWNGEEFNCEANQYDYPISWKATHVWHLKWTATAADAIKSDTSTPAGDTFFAADGGVFEGFTVLSKDEWQYLIDNAIAKNSSSTNFITIDGKNCLVLKPDGFSGSVADSYTASEWVTAEASGLVALPVAGSRYGESVGGQGTDGFYWSATPNGSSNAWSAIFRSSSASTNNGASSSGYSVRLVQVQ